VIYGTLAVGDFPLPLLGTHICAPPPAEAPDLEVRDLLTGLMGQRPGAYQEDQLRALMGRIAARWTETGLNREGLHPQEHVSGELILIEFTLATAGILLARSDLWGFPGLPILWS